MTRQQRYSLQSAGKHVPGVHAKNKMVEHRRDKQEARLETNARNTDAKGANTSSNKQRNDKEEIFHRTEHS